MAPFNASAAFARNVPATPRNTILNGDCISLMRGMDRNSVDFILTDPLPVRCRCLEGAVKEVV